MECDDVRISISEQMYEMLRGIIREAEACPLPEKE
jgi:hypothetical protein